MTAERRKAKVTLRHLPEELKHFPGVRIRSCHSSLLRQLRRDRNVAGQTEAEDAKSHAVIYLVQLR